MSSGSSMAIKARSVVSDMMRSPSVGQHPMCAGRKHFELCLLGEWCRPEVVQCALLRDQGEI